MLGSEVLAPALYYTASGVTPSVSALCRKGCIFSPISDLNKILNNRITPIRANSVKPLCRKGRGHGVILGVGQWDPLDPKKISDPAFSDPATARDGGSYAGRGFGGFGSRA